MTSPVMARRLPGCPSALALDELEAGDLAGTPEEAALRDHVRQCASCRARAAARAADPSLSPGPDTVRTLLQPAVAPVHPSTAGARRRWRVVGLAAVAASAVAAVALLVVRPGAEEQPGAGERVKGALALTVHVKRHSGEAAGTFDRVAGEGEIAAGDELRFSLAASRAGHAVVLGLDASPAVTAYVPSGPGTRPVMVESPGIIELPGSVVADATAGYERVVAIVCPRERPVEALRQEAEIALRRVGNRPEALSSLGSGCAESAVLLRKAPAP